jgi:HEPN domain-containing protein
MTKQEHIDYWLNTADSDLEVAETLFSGRKYLWCLFLSHLVIEKALKAPYVNVYDDTPPKIHNLLNLAKKINIDFNKDQLVMFDRLNVFQISARYPDYKNQLNSICSEEFTNDIFQKTKELFEWLKSQLK